eukprot:m.247656 g.247656  ORF g.247656 m.247656 type:complete len:343 (-) comp15398_c0_seq4:1707-2735(-)
MATDERLQSAFFATLVDSYASPVTLDPVIACSDAMKVMQLMSDSLLLKERDMPMNKQSFGANHETVIAQSRLLASCIKRLETTLSNGSVANLGPTLAEATDSLVQIIEAVAGLVFQLGQHGKGATKATPSVMDNYVLVRARLAVQLAVNHLSIKGVVPPMILAASAVIATHVEAVTEACSDGAKRAKEPHNTQLKACIRAVTGTTSALVASIKSFVASPSPDNQETTSNFAQPVLSSLDALVGFAVSTDSFYGTAPAKPRVIAKYVKSIQAAALALVSACTLFTQVTKLLLTRSTEQSHKEKLQQYGLAIDHHLAKLNESVQQASTADLMEPPFDSLDEKDD